MRSDRAAAVLEVLRTAGVREKCVVELADDVQLRVRRATGFEVDPHHFARVGRCAHCVSTARA